MMNTVLLQFDFSNPVHAQLFGQCCANGIPFQMIGNGNIGNSNSGNSNEVNVPTKPVNVEKQYNDVSKHIDGMSYEVRKLVDKNSGKAYFCISYVAPKNDKGKAIHMAKDLKSKVNAGIKALDKITTIEVDNGKGGKFNAWGYATKATAEGKISSLATSFDYIEKVAVK